MIEVNIPLGDIQATVNRIYGGDGDIGILAGAIKTQGLINPVTVKKREGGLEPPYEIVAGRRRLAAARILGWERIPARVLSPEEEERAEEIAGSENINRLAMHPLDEAALFRKLLENGEPVEAIAKRYDRTSPAIWQRIQLLDLDDGIKKIFREDRIALVSAVALKSLPAEGQAAFVKKYSAQDKIDVWQIKSFISGFLHDDLLPFIRGKQCEQCQKRTWYGDKNLFEEFEVDDKCLDHECYKNRFVNALGRAVKEAVEKNPKAKDVRLLIPRAGGLEGVFGKTVRIGKEEYEIKPFRWRNMEHSSDSGGTPCFYVLCGSDIRIEQGWWKESKEGELPQEESPFAPALRLLAPPKAEAKETLASMERGKKKISATALEEKVREKAYWRLMEWEAAQPEDDGDIIDYLEKLGSFTNNDSDTTEKIVKVFAGGMGAAEIKKLSVSKVFAMLCACYTEIFDMPSFSRVAGQKGVIGNLFDIPAAALKQMYREEIRALLPPGKPAAEGSPKKPGKKRKEKQSGGEAPGPRGEENGPDDDDLAIPF